MKPIEFRVRTELLSEIIFVRQREQAKNDSSAVVHAFPKDEPHVCNGEEVCWCEPGVEDFTSNGGGILFIHHAQVWQ